MEEEELENSVNEMYGCVLPFLLGMEFSFFSMKEIKLEILREIDSKKFTID